MSTLGLSDTGGLNPFFIRSWSQTLDDDDERAVFLAVLIPFSSGLGLKP
jgi:hypothetical protein